MTLEKAIREVYPTLLEQEQDRYAVAHPDSTADLIARIQAGAYIATLHNILIAGQRGRTDRILNDALIH